MANYAHIEDNTVTGVYDLVPENWRNISNFYVLWKDEPETIRALGWRIVQKQEEDFNPETQRLADPTFSIVNDEVIQSRVAIDLPIYIAPEPVESTLTEAEILARQEVERDQNHNRAVNELRIQRNLLLAQTDYTQLADIVALYGEALIAEYQTYRQLLRDLPTIYQDDPNFTSVNNIIFPTCPGA
tara:strand:- start:812 stop:1369 length:558 start_codon:yes stop_codon:yes gene_type:complete